MPLDLKLVIGNKNYSSWSMRAWVLLRQAGVEFEEVQLKFADDNRVIGVERAGEGSSTCQSVAFPALRSFGLPISRPPDFP
jgi:hypothetical protein